MLLFINMVKSKLIHMMYCLYKTLTLFKVFILIKSVLNKNKNHYYYNILIEKCSNQLPKK